MPNLDRDLCRRLFALAVRVALKFNADSKDVTIGLVAPNQSSCCASWSPQPDVIVHGRLDCEWYGLVARLERMQRSTELITLAPSDSLFL